MAEITMTVRQIKNLGLWDKVVEYKGWSPWIINEGRIDYDDKVTFDDEFKKEEKIVDDTDYGNFRIICPMCQEEENISIYSASIECNSCKYVQQI